MIHCFVPEIRQPPPPSVRTATVRIAAGSDPASGSLSANAPHTSSPLTRRGTHARASASLPFAAISSATMFVTDTATATGAAGGCGATASGNRRWP